MMKTSTTWGGKVALSLGFILVSLAYAIAVRSDSEKVPVSTTTVPTAAPAEPSPTGQYTDGTYTGPATDAFYGIIQVQAIVSGGRLADVRFLQYPDHGDSRFINEQAMPLLTREAIAVQNAKVDIITGATQTSEAFVTSLSAALAQAHV